MYAVCRLTSTAACAIPAQARQRSLSAQVILLLDRAVTAEMQRQEQTTILDNIRRRRFTPSPDAPTPVEMLREDWAR